MWSKESIVTKQVSPVFAIIVILVVVAIGVVWFMARERAYQAEWKRESEALQRVRDMAVSSGRARRGAALRASRGTRGSRGQAPAGTGAQSTGEEPAGK